jgi:SAM-dependent methyltransferase
MNPLEHIRISSVCDLCGTEIPQDGTHVVAGQHELLGKPIPLSIVACRRCRFIFQPERFSDDLLTALYEQDTSFAFGEAEEEMPIIKSGLVERQKVISKAMSAYGVAEGAAVLDVGGGRGECCQHLVQRYRVVVADTTECPPVDTRIEKVPGLFSANLENGTFDVVVMNHVLEHVFSPTTLLASAHSVLKEGGIVIVEVPFELYTPLVLRHLGDWRHVAYFCRATLRQFLEKSGFAVERVVLEKGCYGVRQLPVVRAVARKLAPPPVLPPIRNSPLALVMDMLAPDVLVSLVKRVVARG